ncbi:MAG: heavy metal translocating P-type ATPase, partial [Chloroflexota bacterium]
MTDITYPKHAAQPAPARPAWLTPHTLEPAFVVITLAAVVLSLIAAWAGWPDALISALGVIAYIAGGFFGVQDGFESLRQRQINIDLLMILAALGAAAVGEWRDGAVLLFLFSLSNVLQDYAIGRSRDAIRSLFALYPEEAHVQRG